MSSREIARIWLVGITVLSVLGSYAVAVWAQGTSGAQGSPAPAGTVAQGAPQNAPAAAVGQGQVPPTATPAASSPAARPTQPGVQSSAVAPQPAQGSGSATQAEGLPEFRPRLPAYYARVVTEEQRQKIYDIQRQYHPRIAALRKQLEALEAERDAKIEAVLTPQQKAELEKIREEAAAKRKASAASAGQP